VRAGASRVSICLLAGVLVSGCAARGLGLDQLAADPTLITGSTAKQAQPQAPDRTVTSDAMTVRNAVASADLRALAPGGLGWANAETGSRGAVTNLVEHKDRGVLCRRFTTTRESFDGVALYRGESCLAGSSLWAVTAFEKL
jgi:hypothetical protein